MPETARIVYNAEPTAVRFHASPAFFRGILGPVRSGKSTSMCAELMGRAISQERGPDGQRRSRYAIVRNTYRELEDTTLKTWIEWWGNQSLGQMSLRSMTFQARFNDVEADFMFRALDRPEDVKKLLSLEITGAWVNEAREVPKGVIDTLTDRVGQYPAKKDGGCTWFGVIADTNPPDEDHWWYKLAEEERPDGWEFFHQPGGLIEQGNSFAPNVLAENIGNLAEGDGYYLRRMAGKSKQYIRVYYCGQYGFVQDGKPVFPEYHDLVHCSQTVLNPVPNLPLYVGLDFGLTPAAVLGQRLPVGRWQWIDEVVTEDIGAVKFAEILKAKLAEEYPDYDLHIYGDPAGDERAQTDESTVYQILASRGINARRASKHDDPVVRREAVATVMSRLAMDGGPAFRISPKCKITRKGLAGGYCLKRMKVAGDEKYHDKPDKNRFSHPCEAGEYMMVGAGEGAAAVRNQDHEEQRRQTERLPPVAHMEYDPFAKMQVKW